MKNKNRIVILGLDGVPFSLLEDLGKRNVMPNTYNLIQKGIFKRMESSIPEVSSVAWASVITGDNPGQHGIYGFTDFERNSYNLRFPNFTDLALPPFWNYNEGKSVIINVPGTYPVKPMRGVHISGFVSVELEQSVWPASLIPKLKEFDYRLDVNSEKAHESLDLFFEDLSLTQNALNAAYRYLWKNADWNLFMVVFTGTDRLLHFLWDAYEDSDHKYHDDFLGYFHAIDEEIGNIAEKIEDTDLLLMLSDHGFEEINKDVYVNYLLKENGFLKFSEAEDQEWDNIDYSSRAFALDPGRIYINSADRFPQGNVNGSFKEQLLQELKSLFGSLTVEGRKVIKNIYRKEDIYSGRLLQDAPDLILLAEKGFNLKANIRADKLAGKGIFTGKHTQDGAFLLVNNYAGSNSIPQKPSVCDIVGILKTQGKVITL
jgi:predicted AlkP superfamily phosphohydrolase/phosphomutase